MAKNSNLHKAKREKNDEFYTQLVDIEKELINYKDHFRDKVVYCNCDSPESNFVKYFTDNYEALGLKGFKHTWYDGINGDFRSPESIEILKECDIVVTNPPFSLFREFIDVLMTYNKQYLVIGSMNAITYKEIFKLIKDNKLWLGNKSPKEFMQPDNTVKKFGNICWFTNLHHKKRNEELILYKEYNEVDYPKYDNYDAIEVSKTKDIPKDYFKVMGVPISFLDKYNPEQFEILGLDDHRVDYTVKTAGCNSINGNKIYRRLIIKIKNKQL